jgi:hypothetical protein
VPPGGLGGAVGGASVTVDVVAHVAARFGEFALARHRDPDVDRRLLAARAALTPQYGRGFDCYDDWLVRLWWKHEMDWQTWTTPGR